MLNFSQTRGYGTGGTVHIVVNNQIGFTTSDPRDLRSSLYCTDIFKIVEAPIFHVNGDDPEAVAFVTQLAVEFRDEFKKDVVVDIVCFRKLGHNEQDEPMVTQPLMYRKIASHPGARQIYADRLVAEGPLEADQPEQMIHAYRESLDRGELLYNPVLSGFLGKHAVNWAAFLGQDYTDEADTAIPLDEVRRLVERLTVAPEGFSLHPRVARILKNRALMGEGELPLDWGMAESLAYASLLAQGFGVRLSGQDIGRGTFFHRHAVIHDQNRERWNDGTWIPLENVRDDQGPMQVYDSVLSEAGVLAFEYGYATAEPNHLVVWEAQFGDFVNGAQVVIDQFISSGEAKWGRLCGLTMFLPHGYEGQGPEHSSARLERFLQLCAEHNIQVCVPSTPAQFFHMLRRQIRASFRKPLVVMTPKSLLRHKLSTSSLDDLANGGYQLVIDEIDDIKPKNVERVVLCSGKVYFDLLEERRKRELENVAIVRVEQLYPFPEKELSALLRRRYSNAKQVVWCQEEPKNQGAWYSSQHHFLRCMRQDQELTYAGREASASPAVGYAKLHFEQQRQLVDDALGA